MSELNPVYSLKASLNAALLAEHHLCIRVAPYISRHSRPFRARVGCHPLQYLPLQAFGRTLRNYRGARAS